MTTRRKPNKLVLLFVAVLHLLVTTLTWRDIANRPARDIRGSKTLWRILSALNSINSVAYLLIGRRRAR